MRQGLHSRPKLYVAGLLLVGLVAAGSPALSASAAGDSGAVSGVIVDASGTPVAGIPINLELGEEQDAGGATRTDASGNYSITDVPVGTYDAFANGSGKTNAAYLQTSLGTVSVRPNETTDLGTDALTSPGTISGTVVSSVTGEPVQGAFVSYGGVGRSTSDDGGFTLPHLYPGTGTVTVTKGVWFQKEATAAVVAGQNTTLTIGLDPAGRVKAKVKTDAHTVVRDKYLSVVVDGCSPEEADSTSVNDCGFVSEGVSASGYSRLTLAPGRHLVRFEVTSPLTGKTRHETQKVAVKASETQYLDAVKVRSDAVTKPKVLTQHFSKSSASRIRVLLPSYTDGSLTQGRATLIVNGKHVDSRAIQNARGEHLRLTIPAKQTDTKRLIVRVVVHPGPGYTQVKSSRYTLTRG